MTLPREHAERRALSDEVHARPPESLVAPLRISYVALFVEGDARIEGWRCVGGLAERFGVAPPETNADHFAADLGLFRIKCERHSEFIRFKFIASGASDTAFSDTAFTLVPDDWVRSLPGELIVAASVALIREQQPPIPYDRFAARYFDNNALIGAAIAGGAATALTDFRVHADGFSRFLIIDRSMTPRQAGRMVQRLLEIETYRILALMALPVARGLAPMLIRSERDLASISRALTESDEAAEPLLFGKLTRLAAEIETTQSEHAHRFSAAFAYDGLVQRRIAELREERLPGLQTFGEFTERRLAPAMSTCRSVSAQQDSLSQRLARVTQLLSTRVGITRERQNQQLLASMNSRAEMQLRLQETVEGLSIAAIAYYIVGLIGHAARGIRAFGAPFDVDVLIASCIPIVVVATFLGLRRVRRSATKPR